MIPLWPAFLWSSVIGIIISLPHQTSALDWPRWRGPDANGISQETNWTHQWPKEGPSRLWRGNVGIGFSSITVAAGRACTIGNQDNVDTIHCFEADSGRVLWTFRYDEDTDPRYYDGGPSSTPTMDGASIYSLSRKGELFSLEAATGKVKWRVNIAQATGAKVPGWGFASSPFVAGDLLILNAGESGTAVNKKDGKVVWTSGKGSAGYSTAVPFEHAGQAHVALAVLKSIVAVKVVDGTKLWEHPWETRYDVNAADPILIKNRVFVSSGYNHGCALFEFDGQRTKTLWENRNMRNHINSSVLLDGCLYGVDGDAGDRQAALRCIDLATGALRWTEKSVGSGALTAANGKLIILSDRGELIIARADSSSFAPLARSQVMGGKCWTVPVLAGGRVFCRNAQGEVVCVDLRSSAAASARSK